MIIGIGFYSLTIEIIFTFIHNHDYNLTLNEIDDFCIIHDIPLNF